MSQSTPQDTIRHKFEIAGLGIAPFRCVGVVEKRYKAAPDAPSQPGASCEYCGTGIVECCIIRDRNGKQFIVGNECVLKTDDSGLINLTKQAVNKFRREARHQREAVRIAAGRELLERADIREKLAAKPHPMANSGNPYFKDQSLLSWALWMMRNAGNSGRVDVCKVLERL